MSTKEKDIKLLWGRAANRCAFSDCRIKLSNDKKNITESFPLGEQAHIVGKASGSARSHSILTSEERDLYDNLILLCPTHHTVIDKNQEDYPVEKLHMIKSQHEYWVESNLSDSESLNLKASNLIYANLIDLAVENCSFETWENWISELRSSSHHLNIDTYQKAIQFTLKIHKAIWTNALPELECALKYFGTIMNIMLNFYMKNAESKENYYVANRFYKKMWFPEDKYQQLLDKYDSWESYLDDLIYESIKAANWLAEIVRRDINPLFFAVEGKFSIVSGPDDNLSWHTYIAEFSEEEKVALLDSSEDKLQEFNDKASEIISKCLF